MNKNRSTASTNITILLLAIILLVGCTFPIQTESPAQTPTAPGNPIVTEFTPALSNLSGQVVYTAFADRESLVELQVFLKDLETGEVTQLTHLGSNLMPKWSPDGSQIVYLSWSEENLYDIYIMNADGTDSQPLVTGTANDKLPDWSPLGDKIVFESDRDGTNQIYVLDLNSLETTKLTNGLFLVSLPNWSTDGQQIVFSASTGTIRPQNFVVDADGMNLRQLTNYDVDNFDGRPVWCPDDSCIIFTRSVNGVPKFMLLDLATNEISLLLKDVFADNLQETKLDRSQIRKYITFSVGGDFYAINFNTGELFSLGVTGLSLSLYP